VRFSLQDVKKQVQRRGDELIVRLHFLRPGELHNEIDRLIAYYEQHSSKGAPRRLFSVDDARACIEDYRLAHCLTCVLSAWYTWQSWHWHDVLTRIGGDAPQRLEEAGILSPVQLRLALFNVVNENYQGFLGEQQRAEGLQVFAAPYHLTIPDLEYLLVIDSDEEEILVRETPQPPTAQDVATLYNQWVFEAALFNASSVHFVIDCAAFERAQQTMQAMTGTGVGAVIKRLCYLARVLGVYYDLAYDVDDAEAATTAPRLHLTLYGPQEMTGAPQQYGLRLARLCRMLLGYGVPARQQAHYGKQRQGGGKAYLLSDAIVQADATVHFLQRSYSFRIDTNTLSLLPAIEEDTQTTTKVPSPTDAGLTRLAVALPTPTSSVFDSSIEQSFAEAFTALQNSHAVDGWQLIREPEPLLLEHSIFIPDFALTRDQQRIYVEILGFWTPSYRERKIQKLQQLQHRNDIVLAIPSEAREAFAARPGESTGLPTRFPIVWYDGQLSATELLHLLRGHYDDFSNRLAMIDVAQVRERVQREGLLPEQICFALLHCYRRSELALAAKCVTTEGVIFASGIGLYHAYWMEQLRISFVEWLGGVGISSLIEVLQASRERWPVLRNCEDATIEAILGLWPEVRIDRSSIFEASVALTAPGAENVEQSEEVVDYSEQTSIASKRAARGKATGTKKRVVRETSQGDLWG
jgi:predicted nuclease of restriction endonuclease-like RecB superfamily